MKQKKGIGVGIIGMGAYFPAEVRTNDWWPKEWVEEHLKSYGDDVVAVIDRAAAEQPDAVDPEIVQYAAAYAADPFRGSKLRRVMGTEETSSDMEVAAVRAAMTDAHIAPSDVDLLLVFAQIPDYPCPGNHALVAHRLGLRRDCTTMTVGADCASFVHHLKVASALIASGAHRTAIVVQSNASSRALNWHRPASLNVGDGAIASVLGIVEDGLGYIDSFVGTLGEYHAAVRIAPDGASGVPWYRGDEHHARLVFQSMDAEGTKASSSKAISLCREACDQVLTRSGFRTSDVAFFAASQPTAWFGRAAASALGIPANRTLDTFAEYAHLMPASAPLNLWTAYQRHELSRGDLVLVYSPGAGFIQAASLLRWAR